MAGPQPALEVVAINVPALRIVKHFCYCIFKPQCDTVHDTIKPALSCTRGQPGDPQSG
eukprot:CAMPEP_0182945022 /NCGR_PEP_ID=MMETSP0105_2-20130417/54910_1 /TAXON_ID=81532 ORGANISM="Acanthoeca-like sp., Strain 10tr" /NCGR_SAMPLE_ID=MMETSP0105_2 /ASSEMBLY_ACC=CAM_ASM_000205 /LENGTH=57 /DNA_ID=CAMNT_0025085005 /DNA_START=197 /DNA_END=366 /DNA_ORIENTATION=-